MAQVKSEGITWRTLSCLGRLVFLLCEVVCLFLFLSFMLGTFLKCLMIQHYPFMFKKEA